MTVETNTYYYVHEMLTDLTIKDMHTNKEIIVYVSPLIKSILNHFNDHFYHFKNKITFLEDKGREGMNYGYTYIGAEETINNTDNFFENEI